MKIKNLLLVAIFSLLFVNPSFAAESTVNGETQFVFNTLLFLICGFLVMFMAPGFAMLECGLVTSKECFFDCCKKYWFIFYRWYYVLALWIQSSLWDF